MLTYNGMTQAEMVLAKAGTLAAYTLALFPCYCSDGKFETIPKLHLIATVILFAVLILFCVTFLSRARAKVAVGPTHREARWRANIYRGCLALMSVSIAFFLIRILGGTHVSPRWTLAGEVVGLTGSGIAWLTASRMIPGITAAWERRFLFSDSPEDVKRRLGTVVGKAT
jgi:hypothetical protein